MSADHQRVAAAFQGGGALSAYPHLQFKNAQEIEDHFTEALLEIERFGIVSLVGCCEAAFQEDFFSRQSLPPLTPLDKAVRAAGTRKTGYPFFSALLDAWIDNIGDNAAASLLNAFKRIQDYRHWVAHGAYWSSPSAYTLDNVHVSLDLLMRTLQGLTPVYW